jgi:hypothetical protein
MGKLTKENPNSRELVTEVLDKTAWWRTLKTIVDFLNARGVGEVRVEFGFVLDRDLKGKPQGSDQIIPLGNLESFVEQGLNEGTIEWAAGSDFCFYPIGADLGFMLCNDADLHLASADFGLLLEVAHKLKSTGIKVYDSGRLL